jgi:AcrR family transcriptional regulator
MPSRYLDYAIMVDVDALSPEKRAQILQGAATIFAQDGYEGASMSRIAAEANVSKGTLYNHFAGKAQLFAAFIEQTCNAFLEKVFAGTEDDDGLESGLSGIGRRMIEMMISPNGAMVQRVVAAEASKFPELARVYYDAGPARATGQMAEWLQRQADRGRLSVTDAPFAAEQFFALVQTRIGMQTRLHLCPPPDETEIAVLVEAAVQMFLRFYATGMRDT